MDLKYNRDELEQMVKEHCITLIAGSSIGELAYRVGKGDYAIFADAHVRKELVAAYTDLDTALSKFEDYARTRDREYRQRERARQNPHMISSVIPPAEKRVVPADRIPSKEK